MYTVLNVSMSAVLKISYKLAFNKILSLHMQLRVSI